MNNIIQTIRHTARAATVLLIALLTVQTAWAQTNVSDADGLEAAFGPRGASEINVTNNITNVGYLPLLDRDLTINLNGHTISGDGLYFNVYEGCSLTINGEGQGGSVGNIIRGNAVHNAIDNFGTVTLRNVNITTNFDLAIVGFGTLNIGNNVSFNGWTGMPFETPNVNIIEDGNYRFANVVATVTVGGVGGTEHFFENLSVALVYIAKHPDTTLDRPDLSADFSWSSDTYTIKSATGWDFFCDMLEAGETFSGKTVELANDITVTRMAGLEGHEFQGTFDGNKKTLTVSISSSDGNAAPFREIMGATIRNLKVSGTVSGHKHSAGLVSYARGADSSVENTIENCLVATDVSTIVDTDGDCYLGGIVGHGHKSKLTIRGCAFTGSLTSPHNYTGGLQGWSDGNTLILENDLFAASSVNAANVGFHPIAFHVNNATTTATVTNVYYTIAPTCTTATRIAAAGKQARAVTAGTDVTVAHAGDATHYATSGITAYKATGASTDSDPFIAGLLYNNNVVDVLYAGIDDNVSLTLSNTATGDVPDGYQYGYTTNAGTLDGSTLTMPDQDVTVSVNTDVLTVLPWSGDGTESSPYIIYNKDQLDLLAYRVNGTHGETLREDGYSGKFFKLNNDIKYTPSDDWDDFDSDESNFEAIGGYYGGTDRYFCGHFGGNNKTISGIRIYRGGKSNTDYYQGIFGRTDGADIHDVTLADARITGCDYTGGIVGENNGGTVARCHVAADVAVCAVQSYAWFHGGIAGSNSSGTIEQCTSAATLTTAYATSTQYYGGIAGINISGTLRDNLAIGATVPAAKDNSYGAITGKNTGTLQRNYYAACKVADVENATGVGCNNADVTANNGAVSIHTLTLADGITTSTPVTVTIGTTGYYAQGTAIALSYSGDVPLGYQYGFTASAGTLNGNTLTMPDEDVTVSALRSTGEAVEVSYVDAYGNTQTAQAIALDGHEAVDEDGDVCLDAGTYYVGTDITYANQIYLYGDVTLILADGKTMTLNDDTPGIFNDSRNLTIYGQSLDDDAGTLSYNGTADGITVNNYEQHSGNVSITTIGSCVWGIDANDVTLRGGTLTVTADGTNAIAIMGGTHSILGGQLTANATGTDATGIYASAGSGTALTLGCTTASDFIYASSISTYDGVTVAVADGQTLFDEDGNFYSDQIYDYPHGKTLRPGLTARQAPDGNYWTTYYNGTTDFTIDADENACAYTATYGDGQLTLHKLGKEIPKNTAVIIVADNDVVSMATTTLPAYTDDNVLHGVDVDTDVDIIRSSLGTGTFYVLGMTTVGGEQHFGFHRYTGEEMAAHKAFVFVSGSQSARSLTMVFDEASGIESAEADSSLFTRHSSLSTWFTLDGVKLDGKPTKKGLYIHGGKKVVIK